MNKIKLKFLTVLSTIGTIAFACSAIFGASERVLIACLFATTLVQTIMNAFHCENAETAEKHQSWLVSKWNEAHELIEKIEVNQQ